jgi:mannitol-1-/sugar-/sorbitol-6-phosphatase
VAQIECRGVLFDLDGVLVDSTPAVARVWSWWAKLHGFDPESVARQAHGRPSLSTIRELLPQGDHEAENREVERREIEDTVGVIPLPGAMELIRSLSALNWAVATSCTLPLAQVRIRAAGLPLPKHLVTASDVLHGKPNPEPYLKAAQSLGIPAKECVVVEDAPAGIRAGRAAGARVIALRTTSTENELVAAGADWIVEDCSDVTIETAAGAESFSLLFRSTK